MSSQYLPDTSSASTIDPREREQAGPIDAKPVRHPWRWVAIAVIAVLVAMMVHSVVANAQWNWWFVFRVMNFRPVIKGVWEGTILGTVIAMVIGLALGVMLAVMRLSDNPVLKWVAAAYIWFFRSIPRYVLLTILGIGIVILYPTLSVGVPFGQGIAQHLGWSKDALTLFSIQTSKYSNGIVLGAIGLGLSEAAYMAEIARAGIMSVDRGQTEAAHALGMSSRKTMTRIVLPQAMRVIVPPTGNETIAMVKDTSLLVAIPVGMEVWNQVTQIANSTYLVMPAYMAGTLYYIIVSSVLMVGQSFLERRFGRGFGQISPKAQRLLNTTAQH